MSLYGGVTSPPAARPSLPQRLRAGLRLGKVVRLTLHSLVEEDDSTDDNYETVTATQLFRRRRSAMKKRPPLPKVDLKTLPSVITFDL